MSRTRRKNKSSQARERRVSVRGVQREQPDFRKLGRALLALAQAEADARKEQEAAEEKAARPRGVDDAA